MKRLLLSPTFYLVTFLAIVLTNTAYAQTNNIIMRNNDVIQGKVQEVGVDVIKYQRADNMGGPLYDAPKADVYMIIYANGTKDVINAQNAPQGNNNYAPQPGGDAPVTVAPPPIPTYDQPFCPGPGYIWTPGYWAWAPAGYYWVPGVWVFAPRPGYLWTPGYWGFAGGYYGWHAGYWGEHIGYYGGVYYGYGYGGSGYYGGRWNGGVFQYNTAVSRVDVTAVHTTYVDNTVVRNAPEGARSSFNGRGGISAQPTVAEQSAMKENHLQPTVEQQAHVTTARSDKSQYLAVNGGKPAVTAMNKPSGQAFSPEGHATVSHPNTASTLPPARVEAKPAQSQLNKTLEQSSKPTMAQPEKATTQPAQSQPTKATVQPIQSTQSKTVQQTNNKSTKSKSKPASKPAPKPAAAPKAEERR